MKKKTETKETIKCITITIYANDGRKLEIPLEVWQVAENMKMYHEAIREFKL